MPVVLALRLTTKPQFLADSLEQECPRAFHYIVKRYF